MATDYATIVVRRGNADAWENGSRPLASGEWGYDETRKIVKIGDGYTMWKDLPTSNDRLVDDGSGILRTLDRDVAVAALDDETNLFPESVMGALSSRLSIQNRPAPARAASIVGDYDAQRTLFNLAADNTQRTRFGVAKATAGAGLSIIALCGDSTTSQYSTKYSKDFLAEALEKNGVPVAGEIVMANKGGPDVRVDDRVTLTGVWTPLGGSDFLESDAVGNRFTYTSKRPGTVIQFKYMSNTPARWRIDGGTWADLTQVGTTPTTAQVADQADSVHTIDIETTGAGPFWMGSIGVFRTSGIIVLNAAAESTSCADWVLGNPWSYSPFVQSFSPAAVFMNLGINDQHGSDDAAIFKTNLGNVFAKHASSDVFIETSNPTGWSEYANFDTVKYQLASERGLPLVDVHQRFGTYSASSAAGLFLSGDNTHPNLAGYFLKAQARLAALLP